MSKMGILFTFIIPTLYHLLLGEVAMARTTQWMNVAHPRCHSIGVSDICINIMLHLMSFDLKTLTRDPKHSRSRRAKCEAKRGFA